METTPATTRIGKGLAARTDFDPAAYTLVGRYYVGSSEEMADAYEGDHEELTAALGEDWSGKGSGRCESCGTWHSHGAVFRHTDGTLLDFGNICAAEYFTYKSVQAYRVKQARRSAKRKQYEAERAARAAAKLAEFTERCPEVVAAAEAHKDDHHIIGDIHASLIKWGSISEKQAALVLKLVTQIEERAQEDIKPKCPVIEGKALMVTGTVISCQWRDDNYGGGNMKMLVEVDVDGASYRLWGTMPRQLEISTYYDLTRSHDAQPGDVVTFTADVSASSKDESFGFTKRPRKASYLVMGLGRG